MQNFTVTKNHLQLLKRMSVSWDECEFGAPCINPKRPYGNSSVLEDMAEILKLELFEDAYGDKHLSKEQDNLLCKLHKEMETVLQILVVNLGIEEGNYSAPDYSNEWKKIN